MDGLPLIMVASVDKRQAEKVKTMLHAANLLNPVREAARGEELLDYLLGRGFYGLREKFPLPQLILLDANLPGVGWAEIMLALRREPQLRSIPALLLLEPGDESQLDLAYELGVGSYLRKNFTLAELMERTRFFRGQWTLMPPNP